MSVHRAPLRVVIVGVLAAATTTPATAGPAWIDPGHYDAVASSHRTAPAPAPAVAVDGERDAPRQTRVAWTAVRVGWNLAAGLAASLSSATLHLPTLRSPLPRRDRFVGTPPNPLRLIELRPHR